MLQFTFLLALCSSMEVQKQSPIEGNWTVVEVFEKGTKITVPNQEDWRFEIRGDKAIDHFPAANPIQFHAVIRDTKSPKEIDLKIDNAVYPGIYGEKEGQLIIHFGTRDGDRPQSLAPSVDGGKLLYVLKKRPNR